MSQSKVQALGVVGCVSTVSPGSISGGGAFCGESAFPFLLPVIMTESSQEDDELVVYSSPDSTVSFGCDSGRGIFR